MQSFNLLLSTSNTDYGIMNINFQIKTPLLGITFSFSSTADCLQLVLALQSEGSKNNGWESKGND
jgi:hypothetical protein